MLTAYYRVGHQIMLPVRAEPVEAPFDTASGLLRTNGIMAFSGRLNSIAS